MPLRTIQRRLAQIYDLDLGLDIGDFVTTDREWVRSIDTGSRSRELPEKLLVNQSDDGIKLALYLDDNLLEFLRDNDPAKCLHDGNLSQFWLVLEGVSHFSYLVWRAKLARRVSLFELEMQAEIDKFILTWSYLNRQGWGRDAEALHKHLFADARFDERLDRRARKMYENANRLAAGYCTHVKDQYLRQRRTPELTNELRRFYRLPSNSKLAHVSSCTA